MIGYVHWWAQLTLAQAVALVALALLLAACVIACAWLIVKWWEL